MFRQRHWAGVAFVLCALPCAALLELYGANPMSTGAAWPRELGEVLNDATRFAGEVGPIADCVSYHDGDTVKFNAFLKSFSEVPNTTLIVRIVRGDYTIHMKNYDGTDIDRTADWTLHIADFMNDRPDQKLFKGKKCYAVINVNPSGAINFGKIRLPSNLDVEASTAFSNVVQNLNHQTEVATKANNRKPQNETVRRGKPVCCK